MNECAKNNRPTAAGLKSSLVRGLSLIVLASVLLFQTAVLGDVPGFRAPLLDTPGTPSDFRSGASSTPNGAGWSSVDAEIEALAQGLKYDPGLMYKFVHDYIKFSPGWGDLKGPYMTWMDRSGNAFDQASLMIALLEEAEDHCTEYTVADPNYVVGEIQLSSSEVSDWLGNLNGADGARAILARAGIYATVTDDGGGGISNIRMEHVWVKVKIDGDTYEFDPSFKSHTQNAALPFYITYNSAMGYTRSTFLSDADADEQSNYVQDIDETAIRNNLDEYTDNLIEYVRDNLSDGGLIDLIGGRTITPAEANSLPPSSLDYTVQSRDDEFDMANTPDMYRTSLRIQHEGLDETFWSSEIYGRRLSLQYNGSDEPQLVLDGTVEDTGDSTTEGNQYDITFTVTHPYDTTDFDGTVTVKVTSGGFYNIVNGWGDTGTRIIEKHRSDLEQYRYDGESDSSEEVLGESFDIVGLTWLAQTSHMRSLAAGKQCNRPDLINHHSIGLAGQYGTPYIDMPLIHLGVYDSTDPNAIFLTVAGHAGAYEHEVIRQLQDCDAVSAVALLQKANAEATYDNIYSANSSNWSSVQSSLQNYSQAEKDLVETYTDDGFTVRLPQQGNLSEDDWTGIGFQAVDADSSEMSAAYIISGGYSGGAATGDNEALSPADLFDRGDVFAGEREGTYHHDSTDMTIGAGGMPFGLSLSRTYSSQRRLEDGPLGLGWTHNFDITATTRSDSFQALGADSPIDAAAHVVALHVVYDILANDSDGLDDNVIVSFVETWLMDKMMDNLVTIEQGGSKMQFTKVPDANETDGFYNPPTRKQLKLVLNSGNFRLKNPGGVFNDFNSSGQLDEWTDAHGNKVDFTYSSGKLSSVACKVGGTTSSWSMTFSYDGDHIDNVTDSASRDIYYDYDGDGNLIEYTNPDSKDTTYDYDDANDGQLIEVFSPLDAVNPVLTNVYDSIGRLRQQKDANDYLVDYYLAGYRAETLGPTQTDPNDEAKRYSTVVWADEFGRPISATDQLGRESTHEYDGKLRLIRSTSAYGTSSEFGYNQYDRLSQRDSKVKPGSSDPNITVSFDHDSNENGSGRWFIHRMTATDPNGYMVYHYYDYNEPSPPSTVGNLMKIAYPPVDAGTATVEFTYNSYGQILTKEDPNEVETKYEYNTVANGSTLKKVTVDYGTGGELNIITEYTYDSVGNVATVEDPRGNTTTYEYSDARLLEKTTAPSPLSYETEYEYYDDGKLQHVKQNTSEDGWIYHQTVTYNARGLRQTVKGPYESGQDLGINLTTFEYDALGRLTKVTDAESNVTETRYYPDNKVWRVIDAEDHDTVTNTYDANGYLVKIEDAEGNATEYEYNGFGGLKKTIYADGTYTEPSYSSIRETRSIRTRAGDTITMWYDDLNRVKRKNTPDRGIKYEYDLRGRLIETYESYVGSKAKLIKNTYDDAGRITKVEYEGGKDVEYEYDACGNRTKLTYPDATYITYEYDNINRLTKIKNQGGSTLAEYTYDSRSRRTDLDYLNGTTIDYTYDAASRLTTIDNGTDNDDHDYDYTYDDVGNRLTMLVNGSDTHTYTYDDIYQLTEVDYPGGYSFSDDTTFNYDDVGNRTSVVESGTTNYSANNLNQYDYVGSVYYDYDENGNTTYDDVAFYTYDSENRLTSATNADDSTGGMLNAALDNFDLTFTSGGDANWAPISPDANDPNYGGPDSAKSGVIGANDESWLKSTMYGEGTFKFYYKKDAGTNDTFRFKIDGSTKFSVYNSSKSWEQKTYVITEVGLHTMEWSYSKGGSGTTADGGVWVDRVEWTPSGQNSTSLQDGLDTTWPVYTGGDTDWYEWSDKVYSGNIDDDEVSQIEATAEGSGTVSFDWGVDSESGCDYLQFYIDGVLKDEISGEVSSQPKSYSVGAGTHNLMWQYVKDGSSEEGSDQGWVDNLQGPGTEPDPLAEAMDSQLTFTTGGDLSFSGSSNSSYYYDGDAALSGNIDDDEESWMQTTYTASAGDKVSFFWKVSSESGDDLKFYIDDSLQNSISGEEDWQKKSYSLSAGSRTLKWVYEKDSSDYEGDDCGWVDGLYVGPSSGSLPADPEGPGDYAEAVDSSLKFTSSGDSTWLAGSGASYDYYYDADSAQSGSISDSNESILQTIVDSSSSETLKFYWKVSSDENDDYLEFYIDGTRQDRISGDTEWAEKTYTISSGIHTLKWCYVTDSSGEDGDNCGWVDFVEWTGASPVPDSENWQQLDYKHDVYGRRSEKQIDGYGTRYVYDGPHVIAEYDGNNNLLRKFIYGPGIDQAVSMIEVADSNATYYYHYDALGSVIALSDSSGDTVQTYEYSVYGEVYVEDANHTNPYMFAGRRYDIEIGLYYNRARYYNPYTGRFLQTDPSGYSDGMNWYAYCGSNPLNCTDPTGLYADTNESNNSNEYNPHETDGYNFIDRVVRIANRHKIRGNRAQIGSRGGRALGGDLADYSMVGGGDIARARNYLDGDGNSRWKLPDGVSGFRTSLIMGGQNEDVYRHVGGCAAAIFSGGASYIWSMNFLDRQDLAEDRAQLQDHVAEYGMEYIMAEGNDDEYAEWLTLYRRVVEDHASLYGNEAGRLVGVVIRDFMRRPAMDTDALRDRLIRILGDGEMCAYFGVEPVPLNIKTDLD